MRETSASMCESVAGLTTSATSKSNPAAETRRENVSQVGLVAPLSMRATTD